MSTSIPIDTDSDFSEVSSGAKPRHTHILAFRNHPDHDFSRLNEHHAFKRLSFMVDQLAGIEGPLFGKLEDPSGLIEGQMPEEETFFQKALVF